MADTTPTPAEANPSYIALGLHFWQLRSQYRLAKALEERFPDADTWEAVWTDPLWKEIIASVGEAMDLMRNSGLGQTTDDPRLKELLEEQYAEALSAVHPLADLLGLAPDDVLSALVQGM